MKPDYKDITSRIEEKPSWYTLEGVPRYGEIEFGATNIYAREQISVLIGCQGCSETFVVVYDEDTMSSYIKQKDAGKEWDEGEGIEIDLVGRAKQGKVPHYGDPPAHGCVGDTMNSFVEKILQSWQQRTIDSNTNEFVTNYDPEPVDINFEIGAEDWFGRDRLS